MATHLLSSQLKDIQAVFDHLDKNKDGVISVEDIGTLLRALGQNPTKKDLEEINEMCDEFGISLSVQNVIDILQEVGLKSQEEEEEELRIAFRAIDRDNNGYLTKEELKRYLCLVGDVLSEEEVDEIMTMSDKNKDGVIDYEEFVSVMAAHIM